MGLETTPLRFSASATAFFDRQEAIDQRVGRLINLAMDKLMMRVNRRRSCRPAFAVGDKVLVMRPKGEVGSNLLPYWTGWCQIVERTGQSSYKVSTESGEPLVVHLDQLKPFYPDITCPRPTREFEFRTGTKAYPTPSGDGWVQAILDHRSVDGGEVEFLVQWRGDLESDAVWVPERDLVGDRSPAISAYCTRAGIGEPTSEGEESE